MQVNIYNLEERKDLLVRLVFVLAPLLFFLILWDKASWFVVLASLAITLMYVFLRPHLWLFLALSLPSLSLGKVVNIPVTANWVYEARLAEIFLGLVAVLYILDILFGKEAKKIKIDSLSVILYAYLVLAVISFRVALDFRFFVFGLKVVVYSFLAYFLTLNLVNTKARIKVFFYFLAATAAILSAQLFYKFYSMGFSSAFFFERSFIEIPIGPIATSAAILTFLAPLVLSFYFSLDGRDKAKPFVFAAFLLSFTAVFLTLGKGAIASLAAALFILFLKLKNKRAAFALFALWFVFVAYFVFTPFLSGLMERIKITLVDTTTDFRIKEFEAGWKLIRDNPIAGVGIGQQLWHFKKLLNLEETNLVNNVFLQAMIDMGIIGLVIVLLLVRNIFKKTRHIVSYAKNSLNANAAVIIGFVASLIAAFLNGLVEVTFYALPYAIIFWLAMGVFSNLDHWLEED